jgi:tetratricopeptide (TPR) repeat protein
MLKQILVIFLFFSVTISYAQTPQIDSLIAVLKSNTSDSVKENAIMAFNVSRANPEYILKYAKAVVDEGIRQKNKGFISLGFSQMAYGYTRSDNQDKALKSALEAYRISENCSDLVKIVALNNVGNSNTYNIQKAKEYLRKAIDIIERNNYQLSFSSIVLRNYGEYYNQLNMLDSALFWNNKAFELVVKRYGSNKLNDGYFLSYWTLGRLHLKMMDYPLAYGYNKNALMVAESTKSARYLFLAYLNIANYFKAQNIRDSAIFYFQKSFINAQQTEAYGNWINPVMGLYNMYLVQNKKDSALHYLQLWKMATDSVGLTNKLINMQGASFDEQLRQIRLQEEDKKVKQERKNNIQLAITAIGVLIVLILFLLLSRTILVSHKLVAFLNVIILLVVFEFINLLIHPWLEEITHHSPALMLLGLVALAAILVPLHHRLEHWTSKVLVEKNKAIRLSKAKKIVEELESQ